MKRTQLTKKNWGHRILMIVIFLIVGFVALLILRAAHMFYSVNSFKKAWLADISRPVEKESIVIAALGDSTVQGIGAFKKEDGFVAQVVERISQKSHKPVQIYNLSVAGAESGDVLKNQLPQLQKLERFDAVIVAVGPNDITRKKSLRSFLDNYELILKALPAEKTVISSMPSMRPKDKDGKSSYDWYQALKPLAQKYKVKVAPVFEKVNPRINDFRIYGGDFYHPSKAGYKLWTDAFEQPLLEILSSS